MKTMKTFRRIVGKYAALVFVTVLMAACAPALVSRNENTNTPTSYTDSHDTTNIAAMKWKDYFTDTHLTALVDTALRNNQELNITLQEIEIARNEVRARKGEYLPFVDVQAGGGVEKVSRYTSRGAADDITEIKPGTETPEVLQDYRIGAFATWEVDIWSKLHNAKKAAAMRYLSSVEGKNFMVTHLVAELANSYYELLSLDYQLAIVKQNIGIQTDALDIVRHQKEAARVTELAVRRFEAQVLNTKALQYDIQQQIVQTENRINFLVGRFPQPIQRDTTSFNRDVPATIQAGIPSQLLANRPDVQQAEWNLSAAKLDVKVAKARFYPSLGISAGIGLQAFNPGT
jgi:outer membrane protein TolC